MGTFLLLGIVGETDSISPDMEPLMVSAVDLVDGFTLDEISSQPSALV